MDANLGPYSLHPSFTHWTAMLESLEEQTGKNISQWVAAVKREKAIEPASCRAFLKAQNLGASSVSLILDHIAGKSPDSYAPIAMVAEMFSGPKQHLLPLYEEVLGFALSISDDVKACPCQTMVPFYRNHVFAQIKPSTKTRLDLGLALGDLHTTKAKAGVLIDTGGHAKKDRITHRLELTKHSDFNNFAKDWLHRAYQADSR